MSENKPTIIFYTANHVPTQFGALIRANLNSISILKDLPIISVSQKPLPPGCFENHEDIVVGEIGRSHLNIYRQALIGAKAAKTKFIAMAEDDILYAPDHFTYHVPSAGKFAYNLNIWSIYTWQQEAIFSYKDRRNLHSLICERELFIEAMEERFKKWPDDKRINIANWAEPGKYEKNLGVKTRETEPFYSDIANIAFSHPTALSFEGLGIRKKLGNIKATAIPHWGTAEKVIKLYV